MNYYRFQQNNSFGAWAPPARTVYVMADDHESAIKLAEGMGLYWDGCRKGLDCPCCGDRWSEWDDGTYMVDDILEDLIFNNDLMRMSWRRMKDEGVSLVALVVDDELTLFDGVDDANAYFSTGGGKK